MSLFKKKKSLPQEPFVPEYYVEVLYGDGLKCRSKNYKQRASANELLGQIQWNAGGSKWVEVDGLVIRADSIKSLRVKETIEWFPTPLMFG